MGGCMSASSAAKSSSLDTTARSTSVLASAVPPELECNKRSVFPEEGNSPPIDNRPKLQQQPRRMSIDMPVPVIPSRDELMESKRKGVVVSTSQLDFFKMLDEKIEAGGPKDVEEMESDAVQSVAQSVESGSRNEDSCMSRPPASSICSVTDAPGKTEVTAAVGSMQSQTAAGSTHDGLDHCDSGHGLIT